MSYTNLDTFKKVTGYDIESFFNDFLDFISSDFQNIVNYYNGKDIDQNSFNKLDNLYNETKNIEPLLDQFGIQFSTVDYWNINNTFSEVQTKLESCINMGKWSRSSRLNRFSSKLSTRHIQKQNETIEQISKDSGNIDKDSWVNIAIDNQLIEEDYTNTGGKLLNVRLNDSPNISSIQNIIDYLIGDNIYGKDLVKKIEILSDGDLNTISGKDNIRQIFETIMSTIKGSIPEFENYGIPSDIFGTNENIIQYPIIFRSLVGMIQTDKRFTSLDLLDINKKEDNINIEIQARTLMGDTFVNNLVV